MVYIKQSDRRRHDVSAQRIKDTSAVDHSGNREYAGDFYENKEKAQEIVDKLNAKDEV